MLSEEQKAALQVLADVYIAQEQAEKAVVLLDALRLFMPEEPQVLKALSYAYLLTGRYEESLAAVQAFLRLGQPLPDSAPILLIQSRALWGLGKGAEARATLRRYQELDESP